MKRKTFINRLTLGSGGAVLLPSVGLLQSCEYKPLVRTALTETDIPLLNDLAETILPATDGLPGGKAAEVGTYLLTMYNDCMPEEEKAILLEGINELDARSANTFSSAFMDADAPQKLKLLKTVQAEAIASNEELEAGENTPDVKNPVKEKFYDREPEEIEKPAPHYFDILKGLTVSGYFTSEIGMTEAREYLPVPGKYVACMPYASGDKVWAM